MLVVNYILVIPISGIVHLLAIPNQPRGFFDLLTTNGSEISTATLGAITGLVFLCLGCLWRLPAASVMQHPVMGNGERWIAALSLVAIAPLALSGLITMLAYSAVADTVRVISIDQGLARYVFLSHWMAWVATICALLLMSFNPLRGRIWALMLVGGAVTITAASLAWTGGRSIIIVMALPVVLLAAHRFRGVRWLALPLSLVVAVLYFVNITQERLVGTRQSSSIATWIDWEWGRFSMIGFAEHRVMADGFLYGETFLAAFANVTLGLLRFAGIPVSNPDLRSMPEITGEFILGNTQTYVVAGYTSELYINFGFAGIAIGMFLLGWVSGVVDTKFAQSNSLLTQLFWAYLGVLLIFRTLAADANSLGSYLIYSGLPIAVMAAIAASLRSTRNPGGKPRQKLRRVEAVKDRL